MLIDLDVYYIMKNQRSSAIISQSTTISTVLSAVHHNNVYKSTPRRNRTVGTIISESL